MESINIHTMGLEVMTGGWLVGSLWLVIDRHAPIDSVLPRRTAGILLTARYAPIFCAPGLGYSTYSSLVRSSI